MKRKTFLGSLTFLPVLAGRGDVRIPFVKETCKTEKDAEGPYGSRPRHIHFKVRAKGFPELTSQIYFKGDERTQNDFARNAEPARVIAIDKNGERLSGQFDIYI